MADIEKLTIQIEANTKKALSSVEQLKKTISEMSNTQIDVKGLEVMQTSVGSISKKIGELQGSIQGSADAIGNTYGTSIGDGISDSLGSLGKLNNGPLGKVLGGSKDLFKNILSYGKHYIIRQLVMAVFTLAKEGFKNLYSYSDSVGGTFSKTLDDLKSSVTFLTNGLANMFAPIIQVVAPILTTVSDLVGEIANQVGVLLQSGLGMSEITSATKTVEKYNSASKKALTMGIDELNNVQVNDNSANMFKQLTDTTGEYTGVVKILKDVLEPVTAILRDVLQLVEPIAVLMSSIVEPIFALIDKPIAELLYSVEEAIAPLTDMLSEIVYVLSDVVSFVADLFSTILDGDAMGFLILKIKGTVDIVMSLYNAFKVTLGLLSGGSVEEVGEAWKKVWNSIANVGIGAINLLIDAINRLGSFTIPALEMFGQKLWDDTTVELWSIPKIPALANGGVVDTGQMFIANERGAELVGSFGNQTGVMNNQQIIEAVSNGVYNAVLSAMSNSNNKETQLNVYLDGKSIGQAVDKYNRNKGIGQDLFMGGVVNGN